MELNKSKIKETSKHLMLWKDVYNSICMQCKTKLFRATTDLKKVGTEVVVDRVNEIVKNHFCQRCKNVTNKLLQDYRDEH